MSVDTGDCLQAARRLHAYLVTTHWSGAALAGPDPGIRLSWRVGRFVKSYLGAINWAEHLVYMQAQGYWVLGNWRLYEILRDDRFRDIAVAAARDILARQQAEGYWEYPNPEWRGRVATVEGDWATLALLESHRHLGETALQAAERWYRYLVKEIGFQRQDGQLSVNYFANRPGPRVPNNSTLTLRTLARLADASGDRAYLALASGMLRFLGEVQLTSGELPYRLGSRRSSHFLCYQYNAFELLDLLDYFRTSGDETVWPIMQGVARFLSGGVAESGAALYACDRRRPEVLYYTAAVAAALSQATEAGLGDYRSIAERGYARVLAQLRPDGGTAFFSRGDYGALTDRRSYPRYQAMILYHLLLEAQRRTDA